MHDQSHCQKLTWSQTCIWHKEELKSRKASLIPMDARIEVKVVLSKSTKVHFFWWSKEDWKFLPVARITSLSPICLSSISDSNTIRSWIIDMATWIREVWLSWAKRVFHMAREQERRKFVLIVFSGWRSESFSIQQFKWLNVSWIIFIQILGAPHSLFLGVVVPNTCLSSLMISP